MIFCTAASVRRVQAVRSRMRRFSKVWFGGRERKALSFMSSQLARRSSRRARPWAKSEVMGALVMLTHSWRSISSMFRQLSAKACIASSWSWWQPLSFS